MNVLILSSALVEPSLRAEFGDICPVQLPVGKSNVLALQRDFLRRVKVELPIQEILCTVPTGTPLDLLSGEPDIQFLSCDPNLTLESAIQVSVPTFSDQSLPLMVLYGDSVFTDPGRVTDALKFAEEYPVAFASRPESYHRWGSIFKNDIGGLKISGLFVFASASILLAGLESEDFISYVQENVENVSVASYWLDFGHLSTYYQSKTRSSSSRSFNSLEFAEGVVVKESEQKEKIRAEADWYEQIPEGLSVFAPKIISFHAGAGVSSYAIEHLPLPSLAELFVHGNLPATYWSPIWGACDEFLLKSLEVHREPPLTDEEFESLYLRKTLARISQYGAGKDEDHVWRLRRLAADAYSGLESLARYPVGYTHGDFCYSNILYDARLGRVKVIDPRGKEEFRTDLLYELAKLVHSGFGGYDRILAESESGLTSKFAITSHGKALMKHHFQVLGGVTLRYSGALEASVLLFLSMLPLHSDNPLRQKNLEARAFELGSFLGISSCPSL